ncbi:D-threo-aldose 1-dehydrogenase [Pseudarthrobacter equi]|uniref:D-threo-aldose 1-dehydrogenase n=1 Tax=Pseudarthrobacter equi TaxID=728066 RepID=A0A1H1THM9_9MICC|nr:aldo/keto reductase [Pseudarthrobacter equi]SDS59797.1 D-threo-aldose 1-dehydrogenase [Pseudarthrobacter equi]
MTNPSRNGLAVGGIEAGWLGFGAAGIGNLYREVEDSVAARTVDAAWASGVRYFDTAPHYGLGLSEARLGAALSKRPRDEYLISTKVGRVLEPNPGYSPGTLDDEGFCVPATVRRRWDPSEAGIRRSLEESLERLGMDRLDIAYLHDPDAYSLDAGIDQALPALEKLKREGLVGAIGVGSNSAEALTRCVKSADLDLVMLAGRYTLLEQPAAENLLPACLSAGTWVVNVGIYNSGLLAKPTVPDAAHYNYAPAPAAALLKARRLASVCAEYDVELPTAALQYSLRHPAVCAVVVGASKPEQVEDTARRTKEQIPPELWEHLEDEGLIAS